MKKLLSLLFAITLFFATSFQANACDAGGPGATSCSLSGSVSIMGVEAEYTVSVTCGAGQYACCNANTMTWSGEPTAVCNNSDRRKIIPQYQ